MAKTAPYWLATVTHSLLAIGTINRMAAPVTFTIATAVPLGLINVTSARIKQFKVSFVIMKLFIIFAP